MKCRFRVHKSYINTVKNKCCVAKHFLTKCTDIGKIKNVEIQLMGQVQEGNYDIEGKFCCREKHWQAQLFTMSHCKNSTWDWYSSNRKCYMEKKIKTIYMFWWKWSICAWIRHIHLFTVGFLWRKYRLHVCAFLLISYISLRSYIYLTWLCSCVVTTVEIKSVIGILFEQFCHTICFHRKQQYGVCHKFFLSAIKKFKTLKTLNIFIWYGKKQHIHGKKFKTILNGIIETLLYSGLPWKFQREHRDKSNSLGFHLAVSAEQSNQVKRRERNNVRCEARRLTRPTRAEAFYKL